MERDGFWVPPLNHLQLRFQWSSARHAALCGGVAPACGGCQPPLACPSRATVAELNVLASLPDA
jgi:hypothetical protein